MLLFLAATTPETTVKVEPKPQQIAEMMQGSRSTMFIDPKLRAADYQKAFEILKQEKSSAKVVFQLADGSTISNVIEMMLLPNDTLIIFRYNTPKGIKIQVVEIENLLGITNQ